MILLDTHVMAWLYAGDTGRFPAKARRRLEEGDLAVSPMVTLELQYLHEIGRLTEPADAVLSGLARMLCVRSADCSLAELVGHATGLAWTRDPFDRLLVAHSIAEQAPLLTADSNLAAHHPLAVWD